MQQFRPRAICPCLTTIEVVDFGYHHQCFLSQFVCAILRLAQTYDLYLGLRFNDLEKLSLTVAGAGSFAFWHIRTPWISFRHRLPRLQIIIISCSSLSL